MDCSPRFTELLEQLDQLPHGGHCTHGEYRIDRQAGDYFAVSVVADGRLLKSGGARFIARYVAQRLNVPAFGRNQFRTSPSATRATP